MITVWLLPPRVDTERLMDNLRMQVRFVARLFLWRTPISVSLGSFFLGFSGFLKKNPPVFSLEYSAVHDLGTELQKRLEESQQLVCKCSLHSPLFTNPHCPQLYPLVQTYIVFTSCVSCQLPIRVEGVGSNCCLNRLPTSLPVWSWPLASIPEWGHQFWPLPGACAVSQAASLLSRVSRLSYIRSPSSNAIASSSISVCLRESMLFK